MSFILDALKKLEHKQKQGSVPHVLAVQETPQSEEPKRRKVWPYVITAVLLLNAAVLAVWIIPRQSEVRSITKKVSVAEQATENIDIQSPPKGIEESAVPPIVETKINQKPLPAPAAVQPDSEPEADIIITPASSEPGIGDDREALLPEAPPPAEPSAIAALPTPEQHAPDHQEASPPVPGFASDTEGEVMDLQALPESVRNSIPEIVMSGHIYSNSSRARLVNINGNILREGETVTGNLKLEEITPSGAIFNFNGSRFSLRAY